jgi:O-antigen ligase
MASLQGILLILLTLAGAGIFISIIILILHTAKLSNISIFTYLFPLVLFSTAVETLTMTRDFSTMWMAATEVVKSPTAIWITRITSLVLLISSSIVISRAVFSKDESQKFDNNIIIAQTIFTFTCLISPALFSTHPSLNYIYLYTPIYCFAAILVTDKDAVKIFCMARNAMFAFISLGWLILPVLPHFVLNTTYSQGLFKGLPRLAGLATHEVSLSTMTTIFIVTLLFFPYRAKWLNNIAWLVAIPTLFLTQSKNAWATTILVYIIFAYFNHKRHALESSIKRSSPLILILLLLTMICTTLIASTVMFGDLLGRIDTFFHTREGIQFLTFTGRDVIWEEAMVAWRENPLFGYGLTLFGIEHRAIIGIPYATSGHSQFYDTLGRSGLIGILGLVICIGVLGWRAFKLATVTGGLSLIMLFSLVLRSFTEVPIASGYFGYELLPYMLFLILVSRRTSTQIGMYQKNILNYRINIKNNYLL